MRADMIISDPKLEEALFGFVMMLCAALAMLFVGGIAGIVSIVLGARRKRTDAIVLGVVSIICSIMTPFLINGPAGPTFMMWLASVASAAVAIKTLTNRWIILYALAVVITLAVIAFTVGCVQILA